MGKGDKKTKRGKIIMGSYGKLRPHRRKFKVRSKHIKAETVNTADQ
ncbi:RPS31 30S ribosomal protein S31 [Sinomicrobium oceani]|uniref:RPS31 30S ribosomal protein S31 n=1 Tax=Sinomicrobium oceani TaxID=1150368 RepID=A0A1K1RLD7_9FLAO|nr:30S ribosomal protein THX [Sinomicrobium oceani]SFW72976.1 RPS31 30S ribosomal protein S31 [Sinomicrobium oceani]